LGQLLRPHDPKNGRNEIVDMLLKANADPNLKDKKNNTALYYATYNGYMEIADMLKKAGAK